METLQNRTQAVTTSGLKHRQIYEYLRREILRGAYGIGDQVPTEAELQRRFSVSRATVSKAVQVLARDGYLTRRRGTGSFVQANPVADHAPVGFVAPGCWTGIFPGIYEAISRAIEPAGRHLTISSMDAQDDAGMLRRAAELAREYDAKGVRGAFFIPVELTPDRMWINGHLVGALTGAGLTIVLVDRDICDWPDRSRFDLVGLNNRRCAYLLTRHLLNLGRRRIAFATYVRGSSTISARIAGFRQALCEEGIFPEPEGRDLFRWEPGSPGSVGAHLKSSRADAYMCVNDQVAANVVCELVALGVRVPDDVAVVGIDDVEYATLTPVPLTTMRQPLGAIGRIAAKLLLDRLADPSLPPREVLLEGELIIRRSCGSPSAGAAPAVQPSPAGGTIPPA